MIPKMIQNPLMITLEKALLLNRYTKVNEANTITALYKNANVCLSKNHNADVKLLREMISTKNTIPQDKIK